MTLEQLRIFIAVAERQHVTRAAEALGMSQSAVSSAIAALEAHYDVPLFHRVGRGIELTEAGAVFLGDARSVLARVAAAELGLAEMAGLQRGTLAVQASQTIASYWLPRHLVAFRRAHPGIELQLTVGNTAQVAAAVLDGAAELGFIEGAIEEKLLTSAALAQDQLIVVAAPDHPWAGRPRIRPAELLETDWVLREVGSGTRSVFEAALRDLGIAAPSLRVALELPTNEAVRAAVEAGMGATAISASVVAASLEAELLVQIPIKLPKRVFSVVQHVERRRSRAADALLSLVLPRRKPSKKQNE